MGFDLASIFGKGVEGAITSIGDIADKFITTKEEKEQFKLEAQKVAASIIEKESISAQAQLDAVLKDVQDARNREIQINTSDSASWLSKNTLGILALGVTLGFFGMLTWMLNYDVPAGNKDILNIMLGSLGSAWIGITSYFFGSSAGAQRNGEAIRKIAMS